jgi:hypothetical protein
MEQGYIKLFRCIQDNELWQAEPFDRSRAWIDLLLLANYKPGGFILQGMYVKVDRGEVGWSEKRLARRWKWSRGKVRRFLELLKKEEQIEQRVVQADNRLKCVITIINYEQYQGNGTGDDTGGGQAADRQRDSNKKDKKEKKVKNNDFDFDSLWKRYPLKDGKKNAERHFKATVKTNEDWKKINKALDNYLKHLQVETWKKPKNGSTWFNNWPDWVNWNEPGIDEFKICTAKSPAPKDEKGWKHPDVKEVTNKTTGTKAQRCLYCEAIFYN